MGSAGRSAAQLVESASPAERAALAEAAGDAGGAPVRLGDGVVSPRSAGRSPADAANVVPVPLVVALTLLAVGLAAGALLLVRSRVGPRGVPVT